MLIHGNKYDYTKFKYSGATKTSIIICSKHGNFSQILKSHLDGHGCNKCSNNYSKKSIRWLEHIAKTSNIFIQHALNIGEYRHIYKFDGYCKETNTVYEFYGDYWHGNPKKYNKNIINKTVGKTMGELFKKKQ